jgi:hypothetical protein
MMIVAIASSTRGSAVTQADTPSLISLYAAALQDQDEKGSLGSLDTLYADERIRGHMGELIGRFGLIWRSASSRP